MVVVTVGVTEPTAVVAVKSLKKISIGIVLLSVTLFFLSHRSFWAVSSLKEGTAGLKSQNKNHAHLFSEQLSGFKMSYSTIKNSYWLYSEFGSAEISNSAFVNLIVLKGKFQKAKWIGNTLTLSVFIKTDFSESEIVGNLVENSRFIGVNFSRAYFHGTRFINCDFDGADFRSANLQDVVFLLSNLRGALFDAHTLLPFSKEYALAQGMIYVQ